MATPTDDDEYRTIGLPHGAALEKLKGYDPSKKTADPVPLQPAHIRDRRAAIAS